MFVSLTNIAKLRLHSTDCNSSLRAQSLSFPLPPSLFSFISPRSSLAAMCVFGSRALSTIQKGTAGSLKIASSSVPQGIRDAKCDILEVTYGAQSRSQSPRYPCPAERATDALE